MYDLIGDIHGHADELAHLLQHLGYAQNREVYRHSDRKVIFLGDFIDRGPRIRRTLEIVRPMVEAGHALAIMGNHELNALAYHTEDRDSPGAYLRPHHPKNTSQHRATLDQLPVPELRSHLDWFRTLPLWLELDGLRVVHACWDGQAIATITEAPEAWTAQVGATSDFLHSACREEGELFAPVEILLKGKEVCLPAGIEFEDKDGHIRRRMRTRWYLRPNEQTYRTYAFQADEIPCDLPLEESVVATAEPYPAGAVPVFIGHYWLAADRPQRLAHNVACLDYSVAKGGFLCSYRWDGEQKLSNDKFVWMKRGTLAHA